MTHQLAELKLMLRHNLFLDLDEHALMNTKPAGLVCSFLGMRLASAFQPIFRTSGEVLGREALLRASSIEHGALTPNKAFDLATENGQLVLFDRLVRTLHLLSYSNAQGNKVSTHDKTSHARFPHLNSDVTTSHSTKLANNASQVAGYLPQASEGTNESLREFHGTGFSEHELLFLNVHPRLLTSVSDHGRTFEQILHYYSVPTSGVVIEIKQSAVESEARLAEAVNNYRSLGYKIAVDDFGATHSGIARIANPERRYASLVSNKDTVELDRVLALRPDIVKLDSAVIHAAENTSSAAAVIHGLVNIFHGIGAQVVIEGIETAEQLAIARNTGADLLQGYYLGYPHFVAETQGHLCRCEQLAA